MCVLRDMFLFIWQKMNKLLMRKRANIKSKPLSTFFSLLPLKIFFLFVLLGNEKADQLIVELERA